MHFLSRKFKAIKKSLFKRFAIILPQNNLYHYSVLLQ